MKRSEIQASNEPITLEYTFRTIYHKDEDITFIMLTIKEDNNTVNETVITHYYGDPNCEFTEEAISTFMKTLKKTKEIYPYAKCKSD